MSQLDSLNTMIQRNANENAAGLRRICKRCRCPIKLSVYIESALHHGFLVSTWVRSIKKLRALEVFKSFIVYSKYFGRLKFWDTFMSKNKIVRTLFASYVVQNFLLPAAFILSSFKTCSKFIPSIKLWFFLHIWVLCAIFLAYARCHQVAHLFKK